jgi:hypothetical protein
VMTPGGDKNGADINLALDALEMAFTHAHINAFVIVGGDSDFITLVEKLKQYDRKVFVVGGRAFTSQVMQKNCTEFIAYENVVPVPDRRPHHRERGGSGERPRSSATAQNVDGSVALVKRALKLLADREVTPQLGLLKSTLLQLDSSFSERDYGCGSFREFADKLAEHGLVTLKHQGRSTLVELVEGAGDTVAISEPAPMAIEMPMDGASAPIVDATIVSPAIEVPVSGGAPPPPRSPEDDGRRGGADAASLGDGVALVRRVLAEATTQPRWPMYPRQFKQFLRAADPSFDERKYGSIAELMRACQKDGLLKLERDRQGGLRVFAAAGGTPRASVPLGWSILAGGQPSSTPDETGEGPELHEEQPIIPAHRNDLPDDDIGNRISGGAVDVTRETIGGRGFGRAAAPAPALAIDETGDDADDEPQPPAPPAAKPARGRKTAAKRPAAKRATSAAKRPAARRKKD